MGFWNRLSGGLFLIALGSDINRVSRNIDTSNELDYWAQKVMFAGEELSEVCEEAEAADGDNSEYWVDLMEAKLNERESAFTEYKRVFEVAQHLMPRSVARDQRKGILELDARTQEQRESIVRMRSIGAGRA